MQQRPECDVVALHSVYRADSGYGIIVRCKTRHLLACACGPEFRRV